MPPRSAKPHRHTPDHVANLLLKQHGLSVTSCKVIQQLWAGYGQICALTVQAPTGEERKLILKLIAPPLSDGQEEGHLRKILSYEVEQYFYEHVAPSLPTNVAVADCVAFSSPRQPISDELAGVTAMVLIDLRLEYPVAGGKRMFLTSTQVGAAIDWLARFHAASWSSPPPALEDYVLPPLEEVTRKRSRPSKLWRNGGYTYLATRRSELASLAEERSEWTEAFCQPAPPDTTNVAEMAAAFLAPKGRPFESLIHGDVKSENMFSTKSGDRVAFFDFQYVGVGLGVCDVAKLFTCSVPLSMLTTRKRLPDQLEMEEGERALLEKYRQTLLSSRPDGRGPPSYDWDVFVRHWETALVDWCRFQASWGFWGNEEWLGARVRHILADEGWRVWLRQELAS